MQTNLLWTGREYYSLENCIVNTTVNGTEITSTIIGKYKAKIYRVEYHIKTNKKWETKYVEIKSQHSNKVQHHKFKNDGKGNWVTNGKQLPTVKGCIDIDIALTPFTNTLPIKRLHLAKGEEQEIQVLYFDILKNKITAAKQKYIRLSDSEYKFENVPNNFEAIIKIDKQGFIIDYPSLFENTAILHSKYH